MQALDAGVFALTLTATYDPGDNGLRLRASARLPQETYARVRAAGFRWAAKQTLFVAPAWTPEREDLLLELCGEIGDEDSSLAERAEERAERFGDYAERRTGDAERAKEAVDQVAQRFEGGQPILVGHHSVEQALAEASHSLTPAALEPPTLASQPRIARSTAAFRAVRDAPSRA
jgi:hypothetical protein